MSVTNEQFQQAHSEFLLLETLGPTEIVFTHGDKGEMGKLKLDGDRLGFEGDVEEAAQILFTHVCVLFNNHIDRIKKEAESDSVSESSLKQSKMNSHIELVKKWLADQESVTQKELKDNYKAAWDASDAAEDAWDALDAAYLAAYWAAKAADGDVEESDFWVKKYEELTNAKS